MHLLVFTFLSNSDCITLQCRFWDSGAIAKPIRGKLANLPISHVGDNHFWRGLGFFSQFSFLFSTSDFQFRFCFFFLFFVFFLFVFFLVLTLTQRTCSQPQQDGEESKFKTIGLYLEASPIGGRPHALCLERGLRS